MRKGPVGAVKAGNRDVSSPAAMRRVRNRDVEVNGGYENLTARKDKALRESEGGGNGDKTARKEGSEADNLDGKRKGREGFGGRRLRKKGSPTKPGRWAIGER